ncbi:MDR family MFS transporter [Fictibacillus barbaricus]|uniref:MFS family permease n=1 Tax=Fictibacillus barbaricus TaxID=182136 RepID=A0ABU1TXG8_9BACL|nr:MFS transporter [Fictibacillus barbaricus]MDR7071898.1 MFS family permease [Fictibacillus barbaricus]
MRGFFDKWHPAVIVIIAGTLFTRAAFFMTMPFLAIYLYTEKGIDPATVGIIIGVSALTGTLGGFFGGYLSDRIGRLPVMTVAIFTWSAVFAGFAVADHVWHFFLLNMLNGLCRSWFEPISRALLADVTTKQNRLRVFNARYFAINVGAAIGPVIGTHLGTASSTQAFYITAAAYLLYGLVIISTLTRYSSELKGGEERKFSVKSALTVLSKDKVLAFFLAGNTIVMMSQSQMDTTLAQYIGNAPQFENGVKLFAYLVVANAATVLLLQFPVTNYIKRWEPMNALRFGSIAFSLSFLGFGLSANAVFLVISMVVLTVGEIIVFVMSDVLLDDLAPDHMRGTYFGAMSFRSIGFSAGPWIGGLLLSTFGFHHGFYVFGCLTLISLLSLPFFQYGEIVRKNTAANHSVST